MQLINVETRIQGLWRKLHICILFDHKTAPKTLIFES